MLNNKILQKNNNPPDRLEILDAQELLRLGVVQLFLDLRRDRDHSGHETLAALKTGMTGRATVALTSSTDRCLDQRFWRSPGPGTGSVGLLLHVVLVDVLRALHDALKKMMVNSGLLHKKTSSYAYQLAR